MDRLNSSEWACLFTVGHSNHPQEEFLNLLNKHEVQVLVDARSYPYSKYAPQYNREELNNTLRGCGISYLFLGRELGGRPEGEEFYDEEGHVLYYRVAESPLFLDGITRLEAGIRKFRVAVMCSEENPAVCHRYLLIGRVLAERGATLYHIRGDGSLQADSDLQNVGQRQLSLFDSSSEDTWKSLQSVSRKRRLRSSSESSETTESDDWSM